MVEYNIGDDLIKAIYHGSSQEKNLKLLKQKIIKILVMVLIVLFLEEQVIKRAKKYDKGIVNLYEYVENTKLKIKKFTIMSEECLDFVVNSRKGNPLMGALDVIASLDSAVRG